MFQRELELLRRRGQGIGAKLWQLRKEPERRIANSQEAPVDLLHMALSVVIAFEVDEMDEGQPDSDDEWVGAWLDRINTWIWMERTPLSQVVEV